jgi:hypothetical protein
LPVALCRCTDCVATPDEPSAWPILGGIGIVYGEFDFTGLETIDYPVDDLSISRRAVSAETPHDVDRILFELWVEREPAATNCPGLLVDCVVEPAIGFRQGVVARVALLISPLVAVHVVPRRCVLVPWGDSPIKTEGE